MTEFLLYIARSGLYLGVFYAFYLLVMRRTTFFRFNRIAMLAGSAVCVLLPLLRVRHAIMFAAVGPLTMTSVQESTVERAASFPWAMLIFGLYLAGIAFVLAGTVVSAIKIGRLAKKGRATETGGCRTIVMDGELPSFTFGKTIFIGSRDLAENPVIFEHETMHVHCRHYLDLLLFRILQIVWWWNPLLWIMKTELGILHEYEADEGVIKKGIDATQYQFLLVRKAVGEQRFSLASGFQHAQLKNRITMMHKPSSSGWLRLSYLALIPVLAILVYACNSPKRSKAAAPAEVTATAEETDTATVPFGDVEVKPTFNGEDANAFAMWIYEHLTYPEAAKAKGAEGRVLVQFSIMPDGSMENVELLRGVDPDLDAEVLRVVNNCDVKWAPGTQNGEPVKVTFTLPVVFRRH